MKVKVKPLEWETKDSLGGISYAENLLGYYVIYHTRYDKVRWKLEDSGHVGNSDSVEDAKAAAQADYDSQIMSALEL